MNFMNHRKEKLFQSLPFFYHNQLSIQEEFKSVAMDQREKICLHLHIRRKFLIIKFHYWVPFSPQCYYQQNELFISLMMFYFAIHLPQSHIKQHQRIPFVKYLNICYVTRLIIALHYFLKKLIGVQSIVKSVKKVVCIEMKNTNNLARKTIVCDQKVTV